LFFLQIFRYNIVERLYIHFDVLISDVDVDWKSLHVVLPAIVCSIYW
jgi:hypothetical protein